MSTFEKFRTLWTPSISDWGNYTDWVRSGSEDVVLRANQRFKMILQKAPESLLDSSIEKDLKNYIKNSKLNP
jgi:trimethylamine---corrinoid protein Co-methyltransferase